MMVAIMTIMIMVMIMMMPPFSGLQVLQPERYRSPATRCTLMTRFDNIDNLKTSHLKKRAFSSPMTKSKKSVISCNIKPRKLPPSKPTLWSAVSLYTLVLRTIRLNSSVMMTKMMLFTLVNMKGTR